MLVVEVEDEVKRSKVLELFLFVLVALFLNFVSREAPLLVNIVARNQYELNSLEVRVVIFAKYVHVFNRPVYTVEASIFIGFY